MSDLEVDTGWDQELVPVGSVRGYKNIKEKLLKYNLLAYYNGNTYIFLSASNHWAPFISAEAQMQLCGITGSDNVSVSYLAATIPYVNFLEKHAQRSGSIPTSICIGTWRLAIHIDTETNKLVFKKLDNILDTVEEVDVRVGSFCLMPCSFDEIPKSWPFTTGYHRLRRYLNVLFPNPKRFATLLWIIGNAVVDPGSSSKFLLLYGPGGTGKTTVIRVIETILKGCCGTIKPNVLTDVKDDISDNVARTIASNRAVTAGDINLETNKLNLHIVKLMTGHDSIAVPPLRITTRCTVIGGCNDLPNPMQQRSWLSTAIQRRMVVLLMIVKASLIPKVEMPDTIEDCQDLLLEAVNMRVTHNSMPITTEDLLYTVLGDKYNELISKISIVEDVSDQDIFDANNDLGIVTNQQPHAIGEAASLISTDAVVNIGSLNFIKNIKLLEPLRIE